MESSRANKGEACPFLHHARKLHQHGDLEAARDKCLEAVDADFANAHAWALLSQVYEDMEEPWHASEAARQAVRSEPTNPAWHLMLAVRQLGEGLDEPAAASCTEALGLKPGMPAALWNRAIAFARLGHEQLAVGDLAAALRGDPGLWDALEDQDDLMRLNGEPGFPPKPKTRGGAFSELDDLRDAN